MDNNLKISESLKSSRFKKLMLLQQQSPYGSSDAKEALELALLAAAFNVEISLAFINDGVLQLVSQQNPGTLQLKNFTAIYKELDIYDITNVYIEKESLLLRNLDADNLIVPGTIISTEQLRLILSQQDLVLSF